MMTSGRSRRILSVLVVAALAMAPVLAQTTIKPPKNKYTPEQDVKLGEEAAAKIRQSYPLIEDPEIQRYMTTLGHRLVENAPQEWVNPVFHFTFTPVNVKEINAFALPGGPMFINRGMIDSARTEGEVAGVMAHELSHVLLRHGTANATKAQGFQFGALAGAIAGAVVGGGIGEVISQGSQLGLGTWLLRYSRDYEKQADLLGVQIMARAGYDPLDLARVFENIEKQGSGGGPQWMSDHPNPGNRSGYIAQEAATLHVAAVHHDPADLQRVKTLMARLAPPQSMAEVERNAKRGGGGSDGGASTPPTTVGVIGRPVPMPSSSFRPVQGGQVFQASVPANWQSVSTNTSMKFVPENGYGQVNGKTVFTHGAEVGVLRAQARDLSAATDDMLDSLTSGNPDLRDLQPPREIQLSQRTAILHQLTNRSAVGGMERVNLVTTFLANGNLFYYVTIVPENEAGNYQDAFDRIASSIQLTDR